MFLLKQLQEAFARGELKPGLNIEFQKGKDKINNIVSIQINKKKICQIKELFNTFNHYIAQTFS